MSPLRVAYLPPSLRPAGAERQMLALAEGLPQDRFRVDFLAMSGAGVYDERARAAGARIVVIGAPPRPSASRMARAAGRGAKAMRYAAVARTRRYDIVDAWLYPVDVMAALARPLTRTPVIVTGRRNLRNFGRPLNELERRLVELANRLTDAVVANCEAVARDTLRHERIDPAKLRVIRNGVRSIEPLPPEERLAGRRALGVGDDDVLVGCVANYQPAKRHDLLVEAFTGLVREGPMARLVLVGEGPLRVDLERRIAARGLADRVRLHGMVADPATLYGLFDVVVQSSRTEGLSNVLLEAAAAGRPAVATAVGGTDEIVIDGETGLLVPANDADALAAAMLRVVQDPSLRERLGRAARDRAAAQFSMARFVAEYAALYEELAAARHLLP